MSADWVRNHRKGKLRGSLSREKPVPKNRETMDEFLARGGTVAKIPALWDDPSIRIERKRVAKDWGDTGAYGLL